MDQLVRQAWIERLLGSDEPAARWIALTSLSGAPEDTPEAHEARADVLAGQRSSRPACATGLRAADARTTASCTRKACRRPAGNRARPAVTPETAGRMRRCAPRRRDRREHRSRTVQRRRDRAPRGRPAPRCRARAPAPRRDAGLMRVSHSSSICSTDGPRRPHVPPRSRSSRAWPASCRPLCRPCRRAGHRGRCPPAPAPAAPA